jgi:acylphosphatase
VSVDERSVRGDLARLEADVEGLVQGVGFRYYVLRRASALGLRGWVRNEPDGSVRCVAEGPRRDLEVLAATLRAGPPGAVVDAVRTTWSEPTGQLESFDVRSGGHSGD